MTKVIKIFSILVFVSVIFIFTNSFSYSDTTPTPTPTPDNSQIIDLQNKISGLESTISNLQSQEKTLSSQIAIMDNQIKLTEYQIQSTEEQITSLTLDIDTATKKITSLQGALNSSIAVLINRIVATYEIGTIQPIQVLLTSGSASDFLQRLNYLKLAQEHDKQLIYDTQQAKVDYSNQKTIFENEKKQVELLNQQLQAYTAQLDQEKQAKQDLLTQTQGSEATYQSLLAQAQAQLAGFSSFVTNQGGASILSGQTVCDSWGCYYNQRDSQWGNMLINGQSGYSMAEYGCLITSVAMVASHMGHKDILPSTIAGSQNSNFAVGTALLKFSIDVNGTSITRNEIGTSANAIPNTITQPIIVGISYDGGPIADHFVVLTGGSNGNYTMDDPFVPNGHEVPFTDHYSLSSIVEVETVSM